MQVMLVYYQYLAQLLAIVLHQYASIIEILTSFQKDLNVMTL
jgi:hypothetical protein